MPHRSLSCVSIISTAPTHRLTGARCAYQTSGEGRGLQRGIMSIASFFLCAALFPRPISSPSIYSAIKHTAPISATEKYFTTDRGM